MQNPSKYQQAVADFIKNGTGHAVVEAVAGSGKTTTIVWALSFIPPSAKALFLAFNKSIATELSARVPKNTLASTLNGFGWQICQANSTQRSVLDADKTAKTLQNKVLDMANKKQKDYYWTVRGAVKKLIGLARGQLLIAPTREQWLALAANYGVELNGYAATPALLDDFIAVLDRTYSICKADLTTMDFDDQLFMPVFMNWPVPTFDYIFVDEAQDLNPVQQELVMRAATTGRVVAVGDRRQSIYGFRGADTASIPNLIERLKATVLPLSICYRCAKNVVREAQQVFPGIEFHDASPEGEVNDVVGDVTTMAKPGDFILCRTTAPLVIKCFQFIRSGVRAHVRGRDIGAGIIALLDKMIKKGGTQDARELQLFIGEYRDITCGNLLAQEKESEATICRDTCDCLLAFLEEAKTINDAKKAIEAMFSDDIAGVVLSTVHKAKGLEAENVYIIHQELMPHPMAKKPVDVEQEHHIRYVAVTRAKVRLTYVTDKK